MGNLFVIAGIAVCLTAVGAVVGVPAIYLGLKATQEADEYEIDYDVQEYSFF